MFLKLWKGDLLKLKRKWMLGLILLGPFGAVALQALNFGLRYDYLTNLYKDDLWGALLMNIQAFVPPVIILGMAIITSMLAGIEHETNAWKQLIAQPIRKHQVLWSKWLLGYSLLLISCVLLALFSVLLGLLLSFGTDIPLDVLFRMSFYPFLAATPFFVLQLWLAIVFKNQGIALTIGVVCTVFITSGSMMPRWNPLSWPSLQADFANPIISVMLGIGLALLLTIISTIDFTRRDVVN
ncbi:ABC transporter permease [Pontibacillus salicampi]|uniref:ABC transporter permease n=1 Tax=Pontibacillus salicampi TaxID=1449801 RepID=A0ABV6LL15_9BACI